MTELARTINRRDQAAKIALAVRMSKRRRTKKNGLPLVVGALLITTLPLVLFPLRSIRFDDLTKASQGWALKAGQSLSAISQRLFVPLAPINVQPGAVSKGDTATTLSSSDFPLISRAVDQLTRLAKDQPNDPNRENQLSLLYAQLGDSANSAKHAALAIKLASLQSAAQLKLARAFEAKGQSVDALKAMLSSLRAQVELSAAQANLVHGSDIHSQHSGLVAEIRPANAPLDPPLRQEAQGKPTVALNSAKLTVVPGALANHHLSGQSAAKLARAQALIRMRRFPEAIEALSDLVKLEPDDAFAHQQLGLCAVRTRNSVLALTEFQKAIKLDEQDADSHNDLGLVLLSQGDKNKAKEEFVKTLAIQPHHLDGLLNLSNLLASAGDLDRAEQLLRTAISVDSRAGIAHANLASVLSQQGKFWQALPEYRMALSINPNMASTHYGLGIVLMEQHNYPAAINEFKTSLTLNPALADAHNKIELAYRKNESFSKSGSGPY